VRRNRPSGLAVRARSPGPAAGRQDTPAHPLGEAANRSRCAL